MRDRAGNILPLTAMGVLVLTALVGSGVDLSRLYHVQNRLQSACDAGVLAGRRAETTNGFDTTAQNTAQTYFNTNFDQARMGTSGTSLTTSTPDSGNTVNGTATTTVPMVMMQLFGKGSVTLTSKCTGTMGLGNSDVTFVLDTTGSMSDTMSDGTVKIDGLKAAVKNFWVTLNNTVANTNARVRYAFVPYSTTVNVGQALYSLNPAYLTNNHAYQSKVALFDSETDVDYANYQTWVPQTKVAYNSTYNGAVTQYSATAYSTQEACLAAMPSANWVNGTTSTSSTYTWMLRNNGYNWDQVPTQVQSTPQTLQNYSCWHSGSSYYIYVYPSYRTSYSYTYSSSQTGSATSTNSYTTFDHWDFRLVNYDTSVYKTFAAVNTQTSSSGGTQSSTWDGCIEERATTPSTTFTFNSGSGTINPTSATDLDIDTAPGSNDSTRWAPMWPDVVSLRTNSSYYGSGSSQDIVLGSFGSSPYYSCPAAAKTMQTWTQANFNSYVDSLNPDGDTYHDIGMIWGARFSSPTGLWSNLLNTAPANGGNVARHIIYMTDGIPNSYNLEYMAYGVEANDKRITTNGTDNADSLHEARFRAVCDAVKAKGIRIWVIGYTTALTSDLSYCASPNSSYTAANSSEINTAFQQIAKQIGELRISG